jgi:hypothetical protein
VNRRRLLRVVAGLVATGPLTFGMAAPEPARPKLAPGKLATVLAPDSSGQTSWLCGLGESAFESVRAECCVSSVVDRQPVDPSGFAEEAGLRE